MEVIFAQEFFTISNNQIAIFLMGPTPRNNEDVSWRDNVVKKFREMNIDNLVLFVPEKRDGNYANSYIDQVEWERTYLDMSDAIFCWVPRDVSTSMKGLTTNVEFGQYVSSQKLFYGRPDDADNIRYLDWLYVKEVGRKPQNNVNSLLHECLEVTLKIKRSVGE